MTLYIHVEEASMRCALAILLPKIVKHKTLPEIIEHSSKTKLLADLPQRFKGYANRIRQGEAIRALVLVDRDHDRCTKLKQKLESIAHKAGLATKSQPDAKGQFKVVNRIVIEELEAWFFGDVPALCSAYPGVLPSLAAKAGLRDPDAITGGTWEKLLKTLNNAGYYQTAKKLQKLEVARKIAEKMDVSQNRSHSYQQFLRGLEALLK